MVYGKEAILASHPAYNYIARRYGWHIKNLDLDPEEMPDEEALAEIRSLLGEFPARYILWESAPRPEVAARLKALFGLTSVEISPCELLSPEQRKAEADFLSVMKTNAERLRPVLRAQQLGASQPAVEAPVEGP